MCAQPIQGLPEDILGKNVGEKAAAANMFFLFFC